MNAFGLYNILVLVVQSFSPFITTRIAMKRANDHQTHCVSDTVIVLVMALAFLTALIFVLLRWRRSCNGAVEPSSFTLGFRGIFYFIPLWHLALQVTSFWSSPQASGFQ